MKDGTTHLAYKPEHAVERTPMWGPNSKPIDKPSLTGSYSCVRDCITTGLLEPRGTRRLRSDAEASEGLPALAFLIRGSEINPFHEVSTLLPNLCESLSDYAGPCRHVDHERVHGPG